MPDYVQSALYTLMSSSQRLSITPADYAQAVDWEAQGIPLPIVERVISEKMAKNAGKHWLSKVKLEWLNAEVQDAYRDWQRAAPQPVASDWFECCKRDHGGACLGQQAHAIQCQIDAAKAERVSA